MSAIGTSAAWLGVFLTGAERAGGSQPDPRLSLGGFYSASREQLCAVHRVRPIDGVHLTNAHSYGEQVLTLQATPRDTLSLTGPDEATATVAIAAGEEHELRIGPVTASGWISVTREAAPADLIGVETLQTRDVLNNAIGGPDFTGAEADAGANKYRAVVLGAGLNTITALKLWIGANDEASTAIAVEALSSNAVQAIADEDTAPGVVSFSSPVDYATGVSIGTLNASTRYGLWIRTSVAAEEAAAPYRLVEILARGTVSGSAKTIALRGLHRVQNDGLAGYYLYAEEDADPVPGTDTPVDSGAALPLSAALTPTPGVTLHVATYRVNSYGLYTLLQSDQFPVDSGGDASDPPPSAPANVTLEQQGDELHVYAEYRPSAEGGDALDPVAAAARRATHWWVYTAEGADPDPGVDTPEEVAMNTSDPVYLRHVVDGPWTDGTDLRVLVRTMRETLDAEGERDTTTPSTNTTASTIEVDYLLQPRPDTRATLSVRAGLTPETEAGPDTTVVVDAGNNIYWTIKPDGAALYADTALMFRIIRDGALPNSAYMYVPATWYVDATAAPTGAGTGLIEVSDPWDVTTKKIWLNSGTTRVAEFDVLNSVLRVESLTAIPLTEPPSVDDTSHARADESLWLAWDPDAQSYLAYARAQSDDGDGDTRLNLTLALDITKSQAAIEAL